MRWLIYHIVLLLCLLGNTGFIEVLSMRMEVMLARSMVVLLNSIDFVLLMDIRRRVAATLVMTMLVRTKMVVTGLNILDHRHL